MTNREWIDAHPEMFQPGTIIRFLPPQRFTFHHPWEMRINMRYGIPTCTQPTNPDAIYMRNLYHEFFWGPFSGEADVEQAIKILDSADPYWDYDPFCMIFGSNPLPADFVFGFTSVPDAMRKRIEARRQH